jgi:CRISPR-associated endonuclease Csn1
VTRQTLEASGALFNLQPLRKGQNLIPLKGSHPILKDTMKYGGYNGSSTAYFALVEHNIKNNIVVRSFIPIPVQYAEQFKQQFSQFLSYCEKRLLLHNPRIVISKILLNEQVSVQSFLMSLRGVTGTQIIANNEIQLILKEKFYDYCAQVEKYLSLLRKVKLSEVQDNSQILGESLGLSIESNLELYQNLLEKERDTIYRNRPANQTKLLTDKQSVFASRDIKEQCEILVQMLNLFTCKPEPANLKQLGGGASAGIVKFQSLIKDSEAKLIHHSPTGIFSKVVRIYDL